MYEVRIERMERMGKMSIGEFFKKAHSICEKHIGKCTECPLDEYCGDGIFNNTEIDILTLVEIVNTEADQSEEPPKAGKWIPCSERLPEAFDNVLISTKEGGRAIAHRCPNQSEGRFYDLHSSAIDGVVAWQPLPEPYKPEGE